MIKNKWKKWPSVTRPGKYFYASNGRAIVQSWLTGEWYISENGKNSNEMFKTPQKAMKWSETNVVH